MYFSRCDKLSKPRCLAYLHQVPRGNIAEDYIYCFYDDRLNDKLNELIVIRCGRD